MKNVNLVNGFLKSGCTTFEDDQRERCLNIAKI